MDSEDRNRLDPNRPPRPPRPPRPAAPDAGPRDEIDVDAAADVSPDDDAPLGTWERDEGDDIAAEFDRNDPRRRHDPMAPPTEPCECYCLHCGRTFMSDGMWFQRVIGDPQGFPGFWMCPTPNCGGGGVTLPNFPPAPALPAHTLRPAFADDEGEGGGGGGG